MFLVAWDEDTGFDHTRYPQCSQWRTFSKASLSWRNWALWIEPTLEQGKEAVRRKEQKKGIVMDWSEPLFPIPLCHLGCRVVDEQ